MRSIFLLLIFSLSFSTMANAKSYQYTLSWQNPRTHLYTVELQVDAEKGPVTLFQMPAWRPGRYYIQDYAAAVTGFSAKDQQGKPLAWRKVDNHSWEVKNPVSGGILVEYNYYANTMDAGSSMLDHGMAYFNPSNMFMHVNGDFDRPCTLAVPSMPADWKSATALKKLSHNTFSAPDYHDFVDAPTVLSPTLKTLHSRIGEVDYYFHFQGAFPNDKATEDACQSNLNKIIEEQVAIFGGAPFSEYHFIYHLLPFNIGHAVEHKYSSCYALPATLAQSPSAVARLNSITAHEFFHLWNVKRIRPAAMWPYDYQKEAYTTLQWFTEGVTDYYADLTLVRAGLITREQFFAVLASTIESLENSYAATVISCEQSSFDSWLERSDYQIPFHRISYYTLGTRAGLLLDLAIRARTAGKISLDDLFRKLYKEYYQAGKGLEEDAIQRNIEQMTGMDFAEFFQKHVQQASPVDYDAFFRPFGLEMVLEDKPGAAWEKIGIEKVQVAGKWIAIVKLRPGSDAEKAGLGEGDNIVEVDGKPVDQFDARAYFERFEKSRTLSMKIFGPAAEKIIEVKWTGSFSPKVTRIFISEKAKKREDELLQGWLRSQVE